MRLDEDPVALGAVYRRHVDAVMRFVARRVSDPHLAADLTADIFLAVADSAHTSSRGSEVARLFGIASNAVPGHRRRSARETQATSRVGGRRLTDEEDLLRMQERIGASTMLTRR
ncbi:RNA polymerase sigma factor [Streptosporangium sp. NBC_01756]|uniref:RNA polymerase sigma factor n=1 Tax=Streptosporangium sp. NBC_01756 TaxID=2975950 RepID=UPI002DDC063B|nr:sigma factor [Streptosporangium sp. NBC_01756]WSC86388.1 hypothetical protein OIE48_39575 [Streptosporangium sp. NBC_01756]